MVLFFTSILLPYEKRLIISNFFFLGQPFRRYSSYSEPFNILQDILYLLGLQPTAQCDGNADDFYRKRIPKDL